MSKLLFCPWQYVSHFNKYFNFVSMDNRTIRDYIWRGGNTFKWFVKVYKVCLMRRQSFWRIIIEMWKGALLLLYELNGIMTFIMEKLCFLASAAKGFFPLFNLALPHHKQVIQTALRVRVIILSQMY